MKEIKIVCTRVLSPELKLEAEHKGLVISDSEYLEINYLDSEAIRKLIDNSEDPFIFTSIHAIKALIAIAKTHDLSFRNKLCYCISGATSKLAVESGFEVKAKAGNSLMLAFEILKDTSKKLVLFAGDLRREELEEILKEAGIEVKVEVVYEKKLAPKNAGDYDGVMFFSPSQVDAFLMENALQPEIPAFCIGSTTGDYLKGKGHKNTIVANETNSSSILKKIYNYFNIK